MSTVELCVLASGSAGNCAAVRIGGRRLVLIDCGLPPRATAERLARVGASLDDVVAVCLTHLDRDHFDPAWGPTLVRRDIRLCCPADCVDRATATLAGMERVRRILLPFHDGRPFEPGPDLTIETIATAHDDAGSHALVLGHAGRSVGYATDLGSVPPELVRRLCGVDVLAIESNYDPAMQRASGRPEFLQRRIAGGRGHLSNAQALLGVRLVFARCSRAGCSPPGHVVLLHRSQQCNCPKLVRELFCGDPPVARRLVLAEQDRPTSWLAGGERQEQLSLAFAG
jgi:phosphoribosyl 1,2-cyclic phosphodiesterase